MSRYEKTALPPVKPVIFKKGKSNMYQCPFAVGKNNKPHPKEFHASARDHHMIEHHKEHLEEFWKWKELAHIVFWANYCSERLRNYILFQLDFCLEGKPLILANRNDVPHPTYDRKYFFSPIYERTLNHPLISLPTESVCVFCMDEDKPPTVQFCKKEPAHALHPACALTQLDIWLIEVGIYKNGDFNYLHEKIASPSAILPPQCGCMTCREPIADCWSTLLTFRDAIWCQYEEQLSNYDKWFPFQAVGEKQRLARDELNTTLLLAREQEIENLLQELRDPEAIINVEDSSDSDYIPTPGLDNHADDYHDNSSGSSVSDSLV